ncbi:MAG: hypothetical protein AAF208_07105 [Cyanobacteria bacterium P01_A01_bin.45]
MSPDEMQSALKAAFKQCDIASCPLTQQQKQILLQLVEQIQGNSSLQLSDTSNPLDELTSEELQIFLEFVKTQEIANNSWKIQLLNDWLNNQDSGKVQFIRDRYGVEWLYRLHKDHFEDYSTAGDIVKLKVGDRIEVCNALWEWVQVDSPCPPQWFPCSVINIHQATDDEYSYINCSIKFNDGTEYEIQGIYEWNRYHWRWKS